MTCRVCFKILTYNLDDEGYERLLDSLPIEPGITEHALYYGLMRKRTDDEEFSLSVLVHESLAIIFDIADLLKELRPMFGVSYIYDIRFSDIEAEIMNNTSFNIDDELKVFLNSLDCPINLNDGYFEEVE